MSTYITGSAIRSLREERALTQAALAQKIGVSDKAVSKWENDRGLPDISLVEPLAAALGVSIPELMNGQRVVNHNVSSNVQRTRWYVCPVCGNILTAMGEAVVSCCGIALPPLEAEECEGEHALRLEQVEDETFVSLAHPMTKTHHISFIAFAGMDRIQFVKLYPEGSAETRLNLRGRGTVYVYCNRHGLFKKRV